MVEMAISSNASAAMKISPLIDESDRGWGFEQERYSGVLGCHRAKQGYVSITFLLYSLITDFNIYIAACASAQCLANRERSR